MARLVKFTFRWPAPPGSTLAKKAFDASIGNELVVHRGDRDYDGVLLAARVADDGRSAELTVDVIDPEDADLDRALSAASGRGFSIGFGPHGRPTGRRGLGGSR